MVLISMFFVMLNVRAQNAPADYRKVTAAMKDRLDKIDVPINAWKYRQQCDEKCLLPDVPADMTWRNVAPGFYWSEAMQTYWFRKVYTVPEQVAGRNVAGSKIILKMQVSDGGEAYVDGKKAGGVEEGAVLVEKAVPGQKIVIGVRVYNGTWPGAYLSSHLEFSAFDALKSRTRDYMDQIQSADALIPFSTDKDRWIGILNGSAAKVDLDALNNYNEAKYFASLDAAKGDLDQLEGLFKQYTLYLLGYSHIDLAWLWDKAEGEIVTRNTLTTVFKLFDEYPDWIYAQSQAHGYKWMEDDYPEIFTKAKKFYKEGRLEIVGGTWSEHDSNLPSGEGFVRQFLYGKRYFREKFGKDVVIAWTPDSFGYNWNLPQILVKSGMKGFLTQKLGSNEVTRFPYSIFWWEAPDGSRILTYFPPSGYSNSVNRTELIGQLAMLQGRHGVKEDFVIFGVGDHGGGVTRGHLDRAFALKKDKASPNVVFTTAEKYFDHLHDLAKTLAFPTWNDELYLEHHRGTYTTQANNKKNNRRCEQLLMDTEKLASIAQTKFGAPYPAAKIFSSGWYQVLFMHMHDILPGSGIRKVYQDSDKDYAEVYRSTGAMIRGAMDKIAAGVRTEGPGDPLFVFNTLSWTRDAVVEEPVTGLTAKAQVVDPNGNIVLSQVTQKNGTPHILFVARNLPAVGYAVYRVFPRGGAKSKKSANASDLASTSGTFENSFLKMTYDATTGNITSIYDKILKREFIDPGKQANLLQAFKDTQNAWEIQASDPLPFEPATDIRVIEGGPVRITLQAVQKIGKSVFTKYISLYEHSPVAYGRIDVKWHERNTTVKLAFPLNLLNEDAWFEIPYAAISRKAIPKTAAESAKFEVSAQNWVDYTHSDGSAGISLLNRSKYGYDVKNNVMRMTLLRSPIDPDEEADQGDHSIEYALYTHAGDWRAADTPLRGNELNYTPHVIHPAKHKGKLPASYSFFSASPDNVVLTAIKRAEDGDGFIIRFVETEGRPVTAQITLPWTPKKILETNLIEDTIAPTAPARVDGGRVTVPLGKFEIKTLKVVL